MRVLILAAIASAMALLTTSAQAAITVTSTPYNTSTPAGQTVVENFDQPIAPGYTFNGGYVEDTYIPNFAAPPAGDTTYYDSITAYTFAVFTSSSELQSASVYLGSIDAYNFISFFNNGQYVGGFSGSQLVGNSNGNQFSALTNRTFDFNFNSQPVNQIVFSSTGYSFEIDNIAVAPVPEASTWVFMIAGVGLIGGVLWWRRRKDQGATPRDAMVEA
jgi:hypothetical protein